jgi:16S rRNA (uracil1498-N3)-methyltransferase
VREARRPDSAFWVDPEAVVDGRARLSPEESHHLVDVFRAVPGTPFQAIDGAGHTYECVLESIEGSVAIGRVLISSLERGELPVPITLLVGLPDARPAETVVEHAVPLGAILIDFVACERSDRPPLGQSRLTRLERIARAATKQSLRSRLVSLRSSSSLEEALSGFGPAVGFYADPAGELDVRISSNRTQHPVVLVIGPPGGFTEGERQRLDQWRFLPISLGPSRLTTETAALTLLATARNKLL